MMEDIVTLQDLVHLQNKSSDLIWKEGKLFLIEMNFFWQVLQKEWKNHYYLFFIWKSARVTMKE